MGGPPQGGLVVIRDMPLAAIDTETTGVDVFTARIVTAAFVTIDGATVASEEVLLDPGIEIPAEAAKVHGITTEKARAEGIEYEAGYRQIRDRLETLFASDRLVCGMNLAFDLSLIHWDGLRLGYPPLEVGALFDVYVVDKAIDRFRKGKRTLAAMCDHYGVELGNAHEATADALGAARLAWKMMRLPEMASFGDVDSMMATQAQWKSEQAESLRTYFKRSGNNEAAATVDGEWPVRRTA